MFKINTTFRTLFLIACLFLIGCSYNFSEDNFIDLEEPSLEGVSIQLNPFNVGDTINVEKRLTFTVTKRSNQFAISTEIFIGDKRIGSASNIDTGDFTIRPNLYNDGQHTIRVVHKFTSGSGSLAEQLQGETIIVEKGFQFVINREPSPPPAITSAIIENGSISLSWKNDPNLEYVNAFIKLQFPGSERRIPISAAILEGGSYIDTYTILFPFNSNGEAKRDRSRVTYSILLESEFEEINGQGATLAHDPAWLDISLSFVDIENYSISWPKHPLYANFDSYRISVRSNFFNDAQAFSASTQGGTQLIDEPYFFGIDHFGTLLPETNSGPSIPSYNYKPRFDESTFRTIPNWDTYFGKDFIFNPSTQRYYLLALEGNALGSNSGITLFEYSLDMELINKEVIFEIEPLSYFLSFAMKMDPISNNFYVNYGFTKENVRSSFAVELDKFNLSKLKEFSGPQFMELRGNILKTINSQTKTLTLTNIDTDEILYSLDIQGASNTANVSYLSDDGRYFYLDTETENAVYKIGNNGLTKSVDLIDPPYYRVSAVDLHDDQFYYASTNNEVKIIDLQSGLTTTTISYIAGNNSRSVTYDPLSNKILLTQGEVAYTFDLSSGKNSQFYYESDKRTNGPGGDYYLWLTNNKLIHSKGIHVDLK